MKTVLTLLVLNATLAAVSAGITIPLAADGSKSIPNPLIDYPGFMQNVVVVESLRAERRITEEQFLEMAADPATIVLDARSAEKFKLLHIKGAINLSLPDFTAAELAKLIPDKTTRVLIYCNNNFEHEPIAFASKAKPTSLNIYTFNTLYGYGYGNVYELGPLLDIQTAKLPFAGTRAASLQR